MPSPGIALLGAGTVCSVGLSAPAAFAAMRAGIAGFAELDTTDLGGEWVRGSRVPLEPSIEGTPRRIHMLTMAVRECLADAGGSIDGDTTVLLCAGRDGSPGESVAFIAATRAELQYLQRRAGAGEHDAWVAGGHCAIVLALARARRLLAEGHCDQVIIAAVDSLLSKRLLISLERDGRLLTSRNLDGFLPGEAAAAILVSRIDRTSPGDAVKCIGLGTQGDASTVANDVPLRADGLSQAIRLALAEAGCALDELDLRIADLSGEQYFFREASLALSRVLRRRKERLALWHPADCIGEVGSAIGPLLLALAKEALNNGYAPGPGVLCHFSSDDGMRGAVVLSAGKVEPL